MTIPALINHINEKEFDVEIKQAYAELSWALGMILFNNDGTINIGNGSSLTNFQNLMDKFSHVLTFVKTGTYYEIFGDSGKIKYKFYKGASTGAPKSSQKFASGVVKKGYLLKFKSYSGCSGFNINACGDIDIDINGHNPPNENGKDFFTFLIVKQNDNYKLVPVGTSGDGYSCIAGGNTWATSNGCTAVRLLNPKDLP